MRVKLKDVCEKATSNLKQSDILSIGGTYPVYGASGYLGNIDSYHQDKPYIAVVKDGAGIGRTTILPPKSREAVKKSLEKTQQLYDSLMQEYFG